MDSKLQQYLIESLAGSGFALLSAGVAFTLRPDLWASRQEAGYSFNDQKARDQYLESRGVMRFEVQLQGASDWVLLACRSADNLPQRVEWLTGRQVTTLRPYRPPATTQAAARVEAEDHPPAWPCEERRKWHEAHGVRDPLVPDRAGPEPTRQRF